MFSKATEYALRATIYIAQHSSRDQKLSIQQISEAIDSPTHFTAKIMQSLSGNNNLVCSVRGPGGGFYITETGKHQPVYTILKLMGEEKELEKCVLGLRLCSETQPCPMHHEYKSIKTQLVQLFRNTTIEQLAEAGHLGDYQVYFRIEGPGKYDQDK